MLDPDGYRKQGWPERPRMERMEPSLWEATTFGV